MAVVRDPKATPRGRVPVKPISLSSVNAKNHNGVKPSLVNAVPCSTSGSVTLDKYIRHNGIPLGTIALFEDHGSSTFSSALVQCVCTNSINESRNGAASKVVCVSYPRWTESLPGISANKKIVETSIQSARPGNESKDMKIAWRYAKYNTNTNINATNTTTNTAVNVDFTQRLIPPVQGSEIDLIDCTSSSLFTSGSHYYLEGLISRIKTILKATPRTTLVRIVIPQFLNPLLYSSSNAGNAKNLLSFFADLKSLVTDFKNAVAFICMPLLLYPRHSATVAAIELICDTVLELEPFETKDDSAHGFLHINRIANLSDRGEMVALRNELTFKVTRHGFQVAEFSIPVDDVETKKPQKPVSESVKKASDSEKSFDEKPKSLTELQDEW